MSKNSTKKKLAYMLTLSMMFQAVQPVSMAMGAQIAKDISGHWAEASIAKWQEDGLIGGYEDGTFRPDQTITRAEFVRLTNKANNFSSEGSVNFNDVSSNDWFYSDVAYAMGKGYVSGFEDGSFRPGEVVTRAQASVFICNALGLTPDSSAVQDFSDYSSIPQWAAGYIGAVVKAGLMSGYPDGSFGANKSMTRAEAVSTLDRAMGNVVADNTDKTEKPITEDDMVIETSKTVSKETVKGDLILSEKIGLGAINLEGVKVEGDLIVKGGDTITLTDTTISGDIIVQKNSSKLVFAGSSKAGTISLTEGATISEKSGFTGSIKEVVVDKSIASGKTITIATPVPTVTVKGKATVKVQADVDKLVVTAKDSVISVASGSTVATLTADEVIEITGSGKIKTLKANASGIKSEIKPGSTQVASGVDDPKISSGGSGGGSGGSGSSSETSKKDLRISTPQTVSNRTVKGNLIIEESVGDGDVILDNVTIQGELIVKGGGSNSVIFRNSSAKKISLAKEAVRFVFDGTSKTTNGVEVQKPAHVDKTTAFTGEVPSITISSTINTITSQVTIDVPSKSLNIIGTSKVVINAPISNVTVSKTIVLVINALIDSLVLNTTAPDTQVSISEGNTVKAIKANAESTTITGDGKIEKLEANADIVTTITPDEKTGDGEVKTGVSVTGVTLDQAEASIEKGKTVQLTATVTPDDATNKSVTWESNNTEVAIVDGNGLVTGKMAGKAEITVTTADGAKTAICVVTVTDSATPDPDPVVESVEITSTERSINIGETITFKAKVLPETVDQGVTWTVDKADVATIDAATGVLTGNAKGSVVVTAISTADSTKTASVNVAVTDPAAPAVETIEITSTETEVNVNETITLKAKANPEGADQTITWSVDKTDFATIDEAGVLTGVSAGDVVVTATAVTDPTKTATVTIKVVDNTTPPVEQTDVTVTGNLYKGNSTIPVIISGNGTFANTTDGSNFVLTPSHIISTVNISADGKTATLSLDAPLTGDERTELTIKAAAFEVGTVVTENDVKITAKPETDVPDNVAVTGVTLDKATASVQANATITLTATVNPTNATNKAVTWSSDKEEFAKVDQNGKVTGVKEGTATITVTTVDGNFIATCEVTVTPEADPNIDVTSVTVTAPNDVIKYYIGEMVTLTAAVEPNSAIPTVTWTSSNDNVATVDTNTGEVTAKTEGTVTITATSTKTPAVSGDITLTIESGITSVTITTATKDLKVGDKFTLNAEVTGEASTKTVTWTSDNSNAVKVDPTTGEIEALAEGSATITATSTLDSTKFGTCVVTVKANTPTPDPTTMTVPAMVYSTTYKSESRTAVSLKLTNASFIDIAQLVKQLTGIEVTSKDAPSTTYTVKDVILSADKKTLNLIFDKNNAPSAGTEVEVKVTNAIFTDGNLPNPDDITYVKTEDNL